MPCHLVGAHSLVSCSLQMRIIAPKRVKERGGQESFEFDYEAPLDCFYGGRPGSTILLCCQQSLKKHSYNIETPVPFSYSFQATLRPA